VSEGKTRSDHKRRGSPPALPGKPNQVTFAPSILASDFANLEREIRKVERAGCRWLHVDVMDNHFVPNLTMGPPVLRCLTRAVPDVFYDAHLMVDKPMSLAREFIQMGVSLVTVHVESSNDTSALCRYLRRQRVRVGVSLRPRTPVRALLPILKHVDVVLVMTVEPGFGGQELLPRTLAKIRELKHLRDLEKHNFLIQADGGITESNVRLVAAAGAEVLVCGTAVFKDGEVADNLRRLRQAALNPPDARKPSSD